MTVTEQLIQRIKSRKKFDRKKLWDIRWQRIKEEKAIWYIGLFALIFPVVPFAQIGLGCSDIHPFRVVRNNVNLKANSQHAIYKQVQDSGL